MCEVCGGNSFDGHAIHGLCTHFIVCDDDPPLRACSHAFCTRYLPDGRYESRYRDNQGGQANPVHTHQFTH